MKTLLIKFIIFLILCLSTLNAREYVTSSIQGLRVENLVSNDEFLIAGFNYRDIFIFKKDKLMKKYDKAMIENFYGKNFSTEAIDFKYDYIANKVCYQLGRDILSYDIDNDSFVLHDFNSFNLADFIPNGKSIYLQVDNKLLEYNIEKEKVINTFQNINNIEDHFSINENAIIFKSNNRLFKIENSDKKEILDLENLNINYYRYSRTSTNKDFVIYHSLDDYGTMNIFDVEKNKIVKKIKLNGIGLISVSILNDNIYYSNANFELESINLTSLQMLKYNLSCRSAFGNNQLFAISNQIIYYFDEQTPLQVVLGYNESHLEELLPLQNSHFLVLEDFSTHKNLIVLNSDGNVEEKIYISNETFFIHDSKIYYIGSEEKLFYYDVSKNKSETIDEFDSEVTSKLRVIYCTDNELYIGNRKQIDYLDLKFKSIKSINVGYYIQSIVSVDNDFIYAAVSSEILSEDSFLAKIDKTNDEVTLTPFQYSTYNFRNDKFCVFANNLYIRNTVKYFDIVNLNNLEILKSEKLPIDLKDIELYDNQVYINNDSTIYKYDEGNFTKVYEYEINHNIYNAEYFSGVQSIVISNNKLHLLDKENIIWVDKINPITKVEYKDLTTKDLLDFNSQEIERITIYNMSGQKIEEYSSYERFKSDLKVVEFKLYLVQIETRKEAFILKIIK